MTPFVSLWVLYLEAFKSDMKDTTVSQSISLLPDFTLLLHFSFTLSLLFPLLLHSLSLYAFIPLSHCIFCHFALPHKQTNSSLTPFLPVRRWQPLVQGSLLYQVGCLGRGLQSSSGRAAHPHRSNKHTNAYTLT